MKKLKAAISIVMILTIAFQGSANGKKELKEHRATDETSAMAAPVITMGSNPTIDEDAVNAFLPTITVSDADIGTDQMRVTLSVTNGVISTGANAGLTFIEGNGFANETMTYTATLSNLLINLSSIAYTPDADFNGTAILTITVDDIELGGGLTDTDTYTITVDPVNDTPNLTTPDPMIIDEDDTNEFISAMTASDVDSDSLRVTITSTNGTVTVGNNSGLIYLVGNGFVNTTMTFKCLVSSVNSALSTTVFNPTSNYNGSASITITVDDDVNGGGLTDTEVINITVNPINDKPNLTTPDPMIIDEDDSNEFISALTASDVDSDSLRVTITGTNGTVSVGNGSGLIYLIGNGFANTTMTYKCLVSNVNSALSSTVFTPTSNYNGSASITITVDDDTNGGGLTDTEVIDITVNPINDAPILSSVGNQSVDEETELALTIVATDIDIPANTLTYSLDATSLASGMTIDGSTGEFSWTPSETQDGAHEVTVAVSDGDLSDSEILTITVNEVNVAPVLAAIGDQNIDEATNLAFTVSATDADDPANTLTYSLDAASLASGMTIDGSTGEFSWTPSETQDGAHEVTVAVSDGDLSDSEVLTITVNEVNVAPVLTTIGGQTAIEGTNLTFTVSATDADEPANTLTYSLDATSLASGMTIDELTGEFSWTPSETQIGDHTVRISVSDGVLKDEEVINIAVNMLPLGVKNSSIKITVFPNPASDWVSVNFDGNGRLLSAILVDLNGKQVAHFNLTKNQPFDISNISNGQYILRIKTNDETTTKRLTIKH